eukprot:SM000348S12866  [mRNA]  locus=s348:76791:77660:- [translate_table: standard]
MAQAEIAQPALTAPFGSIRAPSGRKTLMLVPIRQLQRLTEEANMKGRCNSDTPAAGRC